MNKTDAARAFVEALEGFKRAEGEELAATMAEALAVMLAPEEEPAPEGEAEPAKKTTRRR
jgi:hypothetical protein